MGGLLLGSFLVLLLGALAGLLGRAFAHEGGLLQAHQYTRLTWPPFIVVGIGAVLTAANLVREKYSPALPSAALAAGLFLPLSAAGFGLGSGIEYLWPDGLVIFVVHLAWATLKRTGRHFPSSDAVEDIIP